MVRHMLDAVLMFNIGFGEEMYELWNGSYEIQTTISQKLH